MCNSHSHVPLLRDNGLCLGRTCTPEGAKSREQEEVSNGWQARGGEEHVAGMETCFIPIMVERGGSILQ